MFNLGLFNIGLFNDGLFLDSGASSTSSGVIGLFGVGLFQHGLFHNGNFMYTTTSPAPGTSGYNVFKLAGYYLRRLWKCVIMQTTLVVV